MEQEFVTKAEAAEILGVHPRTITRMIMAGRLRAKDLNASGGIRKRWVVLKEDLLKTDNVRA